MADAQATSTEDVLGCCEQSTMQPILFLTPLFSSTPSISPPSLYSPLPFPSSGPPSPPLSCSSPAPPPLLCFQYSRQHIQPLEDVKIAPLEDDGRECVCVRMCVCVSPRCTTYFKDPSPPLPAWKNGWQIISPKKSYSVFAASPTEKVD